MKTTSLHRGAPDRPRLKMTAELWTWAIAVPASAILADQLTRHVDMPLVVRALVALVPLLPGALFLREQSRICARSDELAQRIANEAFVFTFYSLIGVFICVDLLENAQVLPGFVWNTLRLTVTMFVLMIVGTLLSSRRYR